jgi:hypothetical protein
MKSSADNDNGNPYWNRDGLECSMLAMAACAGQTRVVGARRGDVRRSVVARHRRAQQGCCAAERAPLARANTAHAQRGQVRTSAVAQRLNRATIVECTSINII